MLVPGKGVQMRAAQLRKQATVQRIVTWLSPCCTCSELHILGRGVDAGCELKRSSRRCNSVTRRLPWRSDCKVQFGSEIACNQIRVVEARGRGRLSEEKGEDDMYRGRKTRHASLGYK